MRKLVIGLALASTALTTPAFARDGQWYVGVEGGAMIVEDIEFDVGALSNATIVFIVCDRGDRYLSTGIYDEPLGDA